MTNNNQEKITFNINIMDLAKIDYLVNNGFYSNRSDFLRTALRNQLNVHQVIISDAAIQKQLENTVNNDSQTEEDISINRCVGIFVLSEHKLLKLQKDNRLLDLIVFGALIIDRDIKVDLLKQTIKRIKVYGSTKGSVEVVKFIKNTY